MNSFVTSELICFPEFLEEGIHQVLRYLKSLPLNHRVPAVDLFCLDISSSAQGVVSTKYKLEQQKPVVIRSDFHVAYLNKQTTNKQ